MPPKTAPIGEGACEYASGAHPLSGKSSASIPSPTRNRIKIKTLVDIETVSILLAISAMFKVPVFAYKSITASKKNADANDPINKYLNAASAPSLSLRNAVSE